MKVIICEDYNPKANHIALELTAEQVALLKLLIEKKVLYDDMNVIFLEEGDFEKV